VQLSCPEAARQLRAQHYCTVGCKLVGAAGVLLWALVADASLQQGSDEQAALCESPGKCKVSSVVAANTSGSSLL
jgi:hypothetical protein